MNRNTLLLQSIYSNRTLSNVEARIFASVIPLQSLCGRLSINGPSLGPWSVIAGTPYEPKPDTVNPDPEP